MALIPVNSASIATHNLSQTEAYNVQQELISNWHPSREVWPLKYGDKIIAAAAGLNGLLINSLFRSKLRLLHHGYVFTTAALSMGPAIFASVCHQNYVTRNIMIYDSQCSTCFGMKAIASLNFNGLIYPLITSPAINLGIAGTIGYRIPYIYEVKELARFWWSVIGPHSSKIAYLLFANTMLASIVVYKQVTSMEIVTNVLLQLQKKQNIGEIL